MFHRPTTKRPTTIVPSRQRLPVVEVRQADFANGTYRIQTAGRYVFQENVVFDPAGAPENAEGGFRLGFFAAISIETTNVVLDLNGKRLSQGPGHYLRQRFFSLIELANSPFVPKQGPANFGTDFHPASNVEIRNGVLGTSSHHGIHGNNNTNVRINDLCIEDFEIGGIALNGCENVWIERCRVGPSKTNVPVNAKFSQAVFSLPLLANPTLQNLVDTTKAGTIAELFANSSGVSDGTVVGVQIHAKGVAVGPLQEYWDRGAVRNVHLKDLYVCGLKSNVNEVVGFAMPGAAGPSAYTPANVMAGAFGAMLGEEPDVLRTHLVNVWKVKGIGKMTQSVADAILANLPIDSPRVHGLDSMAHTIKHTCGVFLSGLDQGSVVDVTIDGVEDTGAAQACGVVVATAKNVRVANVRIEGIVGAESVGIKAVGDIDALVSENVIVRTVGVPIVGRVQQKATAPRVAQIQPSALT